jgi:hypothetical protein
MPSILNSRGSSAAFFGFGDVGVDAAHVRLDNQLAARVIPAQFVVQVAAEHVQARALVPPRLARAQDLGHRARGLPPPHLELEQAILRCRVALREKQVGLGLRVDVIDAPAVAEDINRLAQPG